MIILATLCYVRRDGYTLMVHRTKKANDVHRGKWNGLGGKFEPGETPEECVIREVHEESGLAIQHPKLCGLIMFPNFTGNDWYVFVFTAHEFSGALIDSPGEDFDRLATAVPLQWFGNDRRFQNVLEQRTHRL